MGGLGLSDCGSCRGGAVDGAVRFAGAGARVAGFFFDERARGRRWRTFSVGVGGFWHQGWRVPVACLAAGGAPRCAESGFRLDVGDYD